MIVAACIKKLGLEAVQLAMIEMTRTHEDFPCFCGESCFYLSKTEACLYPFKELKVTEK